MKKLKNYILMLLVPLILLGCVSKGVSEAVEEDVSTNMPYSWAELNSYLDGTTYSIVDTEIKLNRFKKSKSSVLTEDDVDYIDDILYVYSELKRAISIKNTTFNYATSKNNIDTLDTKLIGNLRIMNLSNLGQLETELNNILLTKPLDPIIKLLHGAVSSQISSSNSKKINNPYFVTFMDLYTLFYTHIEPLKDTLKNTYAIDITNIDKKSEITKALATLKAERSLLASINLDFTKKDSLDKKMAVLQEYYSLYLNDQKAYINVMDRLDDLRQEDLDIIGDGGDEIAVYVSDLETLRTKLASVNTTDDTKIAVYDKAVSILTEYDNLNIKYTNKIYTEIASKVVNIYNIRNKIRTMEPDLNTYLKITI